MNNIEKLAIDIHSECEYGASVSDVMQKLETFAKAYAQQQSEQSENTAKLWEAIGRWSAYLATNGEDANLSPPDYLRDAVNNATALQQQSEPVYQICFDCNGNWVDVPSDEYAREGIYEKRVLFTTPPNTVPRAEYKKLERNLDIAKDILEAHTLTHVYDRLIAEAGGKSDV